MFNFSEYNTITENKIYECCLNTDIQARMHIARELFTTICILFLENVYRCLMNKETQPLQSMNHVRKELPGSLWKFSENVKGHFFLFSVRIINTLLLGFIPFLHCCTKPMIYKIIKHRMKDV